MRNVKYGIKPERNTDDRSKNEAIVKKADEITKGCINQEEKAVKLFYFVRDSITYNIYMISVFIEDFKASRILGWEKGYCVQKAVLLAALGRAAGIPTRLAFAKLKSYITSHLLTVLKPIFFPGMGITNFFT